MDRCRGVGGFLRSAVEDFWKASYDIGVSKNVIFQTEDLVTAAHQVRECLKPKTFIGLSGPMGAGKTTLIAQLLKDQNVAVASPTFALFHAYTAFGLTINHVDLYRLNSAAEVDSSGFWDLFADSKSVILTEWVERISKDEIPLDWRVLILNIEVLNSGSRRYLLTTT